MSILIPPISTAGGRDMPTFIQEMREYLNDLPRYSSEQLDGNGVATEVLCTKLPINDDQYVTVTVDNVPQTIVTDLSLVTPGRVFIDYDTGYMKFGIAPSEGTANIVISKRQVTRRDSTIARALRAGLRATWPALWQTYVDTSITMEPNVWDYTLPAIFFEYTGVYIYKVELQNVPAGQPEPFMQEVGWEKIGNNTIKLLGSQYATVGATLRITYAGPYTDLTQLESRASNLPILYALSMLMATQEIRRASFTGQGTASDQQSNPPGVSANAGSVFQKMFYQELQQLSRPIPMAPTRSTYAR